MKTPVALLWMLSINLSVICQNIDGIWQGLLDIQGMELKVVFNLKQADGVYQGTMDSPDQNAFGIPLSHVVFQDSLLELRVSNLGISYRGRLRSQSKIEGTFIQGGGQFPLTLSTEPLQKTKLVRPQEPLQPYPYQVEEVYFSSSDSTITFGGSFTKPDSGSLFPAVVLISGSGPQDRNEEIMGHKPFWVIADHLTRKGIAVLRYDDRGIAESTGNFHAATTADFADDAEAALEYLQSRADVDPNRIGLLGHSEGGLVAAMVAARRTEIGFIILLASPGVPGDQLLLEQVESVGLSTGKTSAEISAQQEIVAGIHDLVHKFQHSDSLTTMLEDYLYQAFERTQMDIPDGATLDDLVKLQVNLATSPWYKFYISYDPAPRYKMVNCPVLALNGDKDIQVSPHNLGYIQEHLKAGGNQDITIKEYSGTNHLFQEAETGAISEYAAIDQTISPEVLQDVTDWILKVVGLK